VRYVLTSACVLGAFLAALYLRGSTAPNEVAPDRTTILEERPEVVASRVPGGTELVVRYRFAGSCTRAKLVYRQEGEDKVLASTTNCRRSLARSADMSGDGYVLSVELEGVVPEGGSEVRLVLESETGTRVAPVGRSSSAQMRPSCLSRICWQIGRPKPMPLPVLVV